jgi:integrase
MGKNRKGKGICRRKDGNWLPDIPYEENRSIYSTSSQMTVDAWFVFWINNRIVDLAPDTKRSYRERYTHDIRDVLGTMRMCDEARIMRFCMHVLRHTYATRAMERGVQPKVLQKLRGHASIKTTMDRYVHVTDDSLTKAVQQFERLFA